MQLILRGGGAVGFVCVVASLVAGLGRVGDDAFDGLPRFAVLSERMERGNAVERAAADVQIRTDTGSLSHEPDHAVTAGGVSSSVSWVSCVRDAVELTSTTGDCPDTTTVSSSEPTFSC
jgi:hypothetical protein